jgi:dolichol-phosphate mannosyltransferase
LLRQTDRSGTVFSIFIGKEPAMMRLLVTIPTYNESLNITLLVKTVFCSIPENAEILVVDDNSPDKTAEFVESLFQDYPGRLHLLHRPEKQGLAQAYLAAFSWGLFRGYDMFLEMDADFSHDPTYIPEMVKAIQEYDVIIGSRNIKGGGVEGWSAMRNFISKGGSFYSRLVLRCSIKDLTGGFNLWHKSALEKIGLHKIISKGYLFQVEMKYRAFIAGCSIKEIPILFADRKLGESKMSKKIFLEALFSVWKIRKYAGRDGKFDQFIKFVITGGLGSITNLALFFVFVDMLFLPEIPVSIVCFLFSATQNYIINHKWSFKKETASDRPSVTKWLKYIIASLLGLAVNVFVMEILFLNINLPFKFIAQACGIIAGTGVNFLLSKSIVFRRRKQENGKTKK